MTPARSLLACHRVVKCTFVYANIRFLNNVSGIEAKLLDYLTSEEAAREAELSIDEVAQVEYDQAFGQSRAAVLTLTGEPVLLPGTDSGG